MGTADAIASVGPALSSSGGGATASSSRARARLTLRAGAGEQAVVADAVEAAWQDVEQEAADELVGGERHVVRAGRAVAAVILVAEGDAGLVEARQPAVRDGDAMGVAREIGEHGLGPGEGRLGVDDPALLADRCEVAKEGAPLGRGRRSPKKASLPASWSASSRVRNRRRNSLPSTRTGRRKPVATIPALAIERDAAARHDHMDMRMVGQSPSPRCGARR